MIGLGSIGQRHVKNLKKLYGKRVHLYAFREQRRLDVYGENLEIVPEKNVEEEYDIKVCNSLEEAFLQKIEIAFISNPTSMHVDYAIKMAEKGVNLFIEKPISDNLENVNQLLSVIKKNKIIASVGYQMRYHPCIKKLREFLEKSEIGQLLFVHCVVGELITEMHQYEDYSKQYIARKKLGGGVVVNQIHELDYLQWILGMPKQVYSIGGKISDLNIDVEDCAMSLCKFNYINKELPVYIQQDMLQKPPKRNCYIIGSKGKLEMDLISNILKLYKNTGETEEYKFESFQRNEMFMEEIKDFIECVQEKKRPYITVEEGIKSLQIAIAIKDSLAHGQTVKLLRNGERKNV